MSEVKALDCASDVVKPVAAGCNIALATAQTIQNLSNVGQVCESGSISKSQKRNASCAAVALPFLGLVTGEYVQNIFPVMAPLQGWFTATFLCFMGSMVAGKILTGLISQEDGFEFFLKRIFTRKPDFPRYFDTLDTVKKEETLQYLRILFMINTYSGRAKDAINKPCKAALFCPVGTLIDMAEPNHRPHGPACSLIAISRIFREEEYSSWVSELNSANKDLLNGAVTAKAFMTNLKGKKIVVDIDKGIR